MKIEYDCLVNMNLNELSSMDRSELHEVTGFPYKKSREDIREDLIGKKYEILNQGKYKTGASAPLLDDLEKLDDFSLSFDKLGKYGALYLIESGSKMYEIMIAEFENQNEIYRINISKGTGTSDTMSYIVRKKRKY